MAANGPKSDALKVKKLAGTLMKLSRQDIEKRLGAEKSFVKPLGLGVIRALFGGELTISEVGQKMFLAPATLVPVIDSLEREGLVKRKPSIMDRRKTPLTLTAKGKELFHRVPFVHKDDSLVKALAALGPKKSAELVKGLSEIIDYMSPDGGLAEKMLSQEK